MSEEISPKFINEALRVPRMDVHMRLAARMLLSASTCQDELQRFQFVIRAAQGMIEECKAQGLELDEGLLVVADVMTRSFSLAKPVALQSGLKLQPIPWCFAQTEENFEAYIASWWDTELIFIPELLAECKEPWLKICCSRCGYVIADGAYEDWMSNTVSEKSRKYGVVPDPAKLSTVCPVCGADWTETGCWTTIQRAAETGERKPIRIIKYYRPVEEPIWRFFFDVTSHALTPEGYSRLLGNFLSFYSQDVAVIAARVAKSISPTIFKEVEATLAAEKEAAGEAEDEDSLD